MIRSLFDSEDEKKESEKIEEKINESPKPENLNDTQTVETQPLTSADTIETQPVLNESAAPVEARKEEILENPDENILSSDSQAVFDFESEKIVKEIEFGDNFLELEKEVAKIEEEVRFESEAKIEEEEIITVNENPVLAENKSAAEKSEPTQNGIFTAAINKSEQEKKSPESLENLLIMPGETSPVSDVSADENQGFILPNRVEPATGNTALIQTNETPPTDYKPESKAEIIRKSGLAWSAGIAFFGSVVFLLIIGWFADLLLGTSPWCAVGGVVLGSIIGFLQLFRLTSQILKDVD